KRLTSSRPSRTRTACARNWSFWNVALFPRAFASERSSTATPQDILRSPGTGSGRGVREKGPPKIAALTVRSGGIWRKVQRAPHYPVGDGAKGNLVCVAI